MDGDYVDDACSTFPLEDVSIIGGPELLQGSSGGDSEGDDGSESGGDDDDGPGYDDQGTDSTPDTDVESAPGTGRNLSARGVGPSLHHSARARPGVRVCRLWFHIERHALCLLPKSLLDRCVRLSVQMHRDYAAYSCTTPSS
jgi:hypothetical protein